MRKRIKSYWRKATNNIVITLTISAISILIFSGSSFEISFEWKKKKNSFIENISDMADGAVGSYHAIKKVVMR